MLQKTGSCKNGSRSARFFLPLASPARQPFSGWLTEFLFLVRRDLRLLVPLRTERRLRRKSLSRPKLLAMFPQPAEAGTPTMCLVGDGWFDDPFGLPTAVKVTSGKDDS